MVWFSGDVFCVAAVVAMSSGCFFFFMEAGFSAERTICRSAEVPDREGLFCKTETKSALFPLPLPPPALPPSSTKGILLSAAAIRIPCMNRTAVANPRTSGRGKRSMCRIGK